MHDQYTVERLRAVEELLKELLGASPDLEQMIQAAHAPLAFGGELQDPRTDEARAARRFHETVQACKRRLLIDARRAAGAAPDDAVDLESDW
jgi:hypothetical protein